MKTTKKRNAEFQKCKYVILNFCKDVGKINWGKEVKIAKKLLKVCPDMENWGKINMAEKPTSLSWFLTEEGREFLVLAEKRRKLDLDTKKTYSLLENKIGKDPTVKSKKPKSTLDFLNSNP